MIFISPESHKDLILNKKSLISIDNKESYSIIKGVPILLPEKTNPDWSRELIEIIFWEYPEVIKKIYKEIESGNTSDWNEIYVKYIKEVHKSKENILNGFNSYKQKETSLWITGDKSGSITKSQIKDFKKFTKKSIGKKRTITKIKGTGNIWDRYRYFGELVCKEKTEKILELATGAGGGTASVALYMPKNSELYTVDIGFDCLGNAFGIGKYQKKTIVPVCANFWYLPFRDRTFKTVCTVCGLDESREMPKTLEEVSRVLSDDGRFVVISRNNAFMRQYRILEPFGFTEQETIEILKDCRMYSDLNNLDEICNSLGMKLISRKEYRDNENVAFSVSEYQKSIEKKTIDDLLGEAEKLIPDEMLPDLPFMESAPDVHDWYGFEHEIWELGEEIRQLIAENNNKLSESQIERVINICLDEKAKRGRQSFVMLLGRKKYYKYSERIVHLLNSDDVDGQVIDMLYKMGAGQYVEEIKPFLKHNRTWIRNKAKKYIEKYK